jgi:hypothetical protein
MENIGKKLSTEINKNNKKLILSSLHISVDNIVILFIINKITITDVLLVFISPKTKSFMEKNGIFWTIADY